MPHDKKERALRRVLEAIEAGCTLSEACEFADIDRKTLWRWREADPTVDTRINQIIDRQTDDIEAAVMRKAVSDDPAHNVLQMFMLKTRRREIYGDRSQVDIATPEPLQVEHTHTGDAKVDVDAAAVVSVLQNAGLIIVGRDRRIDRSGDRADDQDSLRGPDADGSPDGVPDAGPA